MESLPVVVLHSRYLRLVPAAAPADGGSSSSSGGGAGVVGAELAVHALPGAAVTAEQLQLAAFMALLPPAMACW